MAKKIRVIFMAQYSDKGSPGDLQRVYNYIPLLEKEGIECTVSPGQKYRYFKNNYLLKVAIIGVLTTTRRFLDIFRIRKYDVVYFHREVYQTSVFPIFEWIYSRLNKNMVFDFDDAIYLENKYIPNILTWSKEIVAGNNNLMRYASKYNKNITVIHTVLKEDEFTFTKKYDSKKKGSKTIIGWVGNVEPHLKNLKLVKSAVKALGEKYDIEFRIIGAQGNKEIEKMYADVPCVKIIDYVKSEEVQKELIKFDIGIMPLTNDEWNAGKCARKLLEYMGVGLATVSSPVGMNADVIQEGKNGFLAKNNKEWYDRLEKLVKDPKLRASIGREAKRTITSKYLLKPCSKKLIAVLRRAATG